MPMIKTIRLINTIEAGTTSGVALQNLLLSSSNLGDFNVLLGLRGQARRISASPTVLNAFSISQIARDATVLSPTTMIAISQSSIAMSTVSSNQTFVTAINTNPAALNIILNSLFSVGAYLNRCRINEGLLSSSTLASQATLSDVLSNDTALTDLLSSSIATSAITASSTAMRAVASSASAMSLALASTSAITAFAASIVAMREIWANDTATDSMISNSAARLAIYNSDNALTQLQFNPIQIQRIISTRATLLQLSHNGTTGAGTTRPGSVIILRRYYNAFDQDQIGYGRSPNIGGPVAGQGGRTIRTGSGAVGSFSGTYVQNGLFPGVNNDSSNFVSSASSLANLSTFSYTTHPYAGALYATAFVYFIPV